MKQLTLRAKLSQGNLCEKRDIFKLPCQEALAWAIELIEKYAPKAEWGKCIEAQAEDWSLKWVMSYGDWTLVQDKKTGNVEASATQKESGPASPDYQAFVIEAA